MLKIHNKVLLIFIILLIFLFGVDISVFSARADELSTNIQEQINNLDLKELENFFNENAGEIDFFSYVNSLLNGQYKAEYSSVFSYVLDTFLSGVSNYLPTIFSIIAISILYGIVKNSSANSNANGVCQVTLFVCLLGVILLSSTQIIGFYKNIKNIIKNIAKLTEIMSPIIVTLMVAVGGKASAAVYSPTVSFLSSGVIAIVLKVLMPLIGLMTFFNVSASFTNVISLNKFSDFFTGIIKWVLGITITVFTIFLSVQGIASAHFDGISIKAAKYAITNSIPIVGGFIKDGFDLVVAGSILIKNSIGISIIVLLFAMILTPTLHLGVFSLLLKFTAAIVEPISDTKISGVCTSLSKTISYLTAMLLVVGLMLFITVLLMIFSANAFI